MRRCENLSSRSRRSTRRRLVATGSRGPRHGALLFHEDQIFFAPALPLEDVFDPTGAGDTFAGGFIGHIAATRDISFENMKTAIIKGSALASFCVEKFGNTRMKEITAADIDARVRQFVDLVNFDITLAAE